MKILILSPLHPKLSHERSGSKILAELLKNIALSGHQVSWATVCPPKPLNKETEVTLKNLGVHYFGDFSNEVEFEPGSSFKLLHRLWTLRACLIPFANDDFPRFYNPERTFNRLKSSKADIFLLFFDTLFEKLLPYMKGMPVIAYWGKPKFAAPMARLKSGFEGNKIKRWLLYRFYEHQSKCYFQRARYLTKLSIVCAVDAFEYEKNSIPCQYISNTWPDAFGESWREEREKAEKKSSKIRILGNIGSLAGTGNSYGLIFLSEKVLPLLDSYLSGFDWEINICGGQQFFPKVALRLKMLLEHPRINIKGWVPDIDLEMISNQIFLLLNNVGPFPASYTRVGYIFSSGGCLVAHRNLAKSTPELKHRENALLGESPEEIAELLKEVVQNPDLRRKIGEGARQTYKKSFCSSVVAKKIINLAQESLENNNK